MPLFLASECASEVWRTEEPLQAAIVDSTKSMQVIAATIWTKYKGHDRGAESGEGRRAKAMRLLAAIGGDLPECGDKHVNDFDTHDEPHGNDDDDQDPWGNDLTSSTSNGNGAGPADGPP